MAKYLLVTTDDFGMCHSVNLGIEEALTRGIATASNFLVACPWFVTQRLLAKNSALFVRRTIHRANGLLKFVLKIRLLLMTLGAVKKLKHVVLN